MRKAIGLTSLVLTAGFVSTVGCRPARPAPPPGPNAGVVRQKPFIAFGSARSSQSKSAAVDDSITPTVLLQMHARGDGPVPLSQYGRQPVRTLSAFPLRADLSADRLASKLGPPAAWADYGDAWYVYRLTNGRELWLYFSPPDHNRLLAADVVGRVEDGYTRERVFGGADTR